MTNSKYIYTIGFTGTRNGMSALQRDHVRAIVGGLAQRYNSAHSDDGRVIGLHGGCIGADAQFDSIIEEYGHSCNLRPSNLPAEYKATGLAAVCIDQPTDPISRNHKIVIDSNIMIAAPLAEPSPRSGTLATIQYARVRGVPLWIVEPDGHVKYEPPTYSDRYLRKLAQTYPAALQQLLLTPDLLTPAALSQAIEIATTYKHTAAPHVQLKLHAIACDPDTPDFVRVAAQKALNYASPRMR